MVRSIRIDGKKFAALVEQRLMSQKAFADAGGVGPSTVFRLTRPGTHGMLVNRFRQLAAALNLSPDELRTEIGADPSPSRSPTASKIATAIRPQSPTDFLAAESARTGIPADALLARIVAHFTSIPETDRQRILAGPPSDPRLRLAASPMGRRTSKPAK